MKNKRLYEKVLIIILIIIALPFTLGFLSIFLVAYILIAPIEYQVYKRSRYYEILNEKYYLLITISKSYKRFRLVMKNSKDIKLIDDYLIEVNSNTVLVLVDSSLITSNYDFKGLIPSSNTFNNITYLVNKSNLDKSIIKELKLIDNIIIYSN